MAIDDVVNQPEPGFEIRLSLATSAAELGHLELRRTPILATQPYTFTALVARRAVLAAVSTCWLVHRRRPDC